MLSNHAKIVLNTRNSLQQSLQSHTHLSYLHLSYDLNNYHSLLTHISEVDDPRWVLFISPPGKPNVNFLTQAGINKNRIIILPQNRVDNADELMKMALASNNYATVIGWNKQCEKATQDELRLIAEKNKTHCFIYCAQ
ncbi:SulA-like leucine-rich domain-containing protein [Psychromonas sp. MME2]|uniref:SulA-like leucine-rich domain-containing protein n=1 Tax=unclassified Psychromonas TaxID=2614957 RepID=UPI00339D2A13